MNGAFYIGATGLDAQQRALDVIAHDIANINTVGYKRTALRFSELTAAPGATAISPVAGNEGINAGVSLNAASRVWTPGEIRQTGNAMDVAIDGAGYIEALGASGEPVLWRGGTLKVDQDGYLATADGTRLRAMISVPQDATGIAIARDGSVVAQMPGDAGTETIGRIDLVTVKDPDSLTDAGGGFYGVSDPSTIMNAEANQDGAGALVQGALEQANVQLSDEMVTLMLLQRSYAANAQLVQAGDQLMSIANNLRR